MVDVAYEREATPTLAGKFLIECCFIQVSVESVIIVFNVNFRS